ncbi:3-isopropylmalate dehydrogenase [Blochmannia endosymbiont of Polyrhachis (Hedomyrma) turneri]|uniref:3-isopropylmalate dehydrogenase n=1 Tax=Blochmannia endosymbiont of Polyrhachis (Hedomyrma) turneri TaxID=1505596 RepID=UPI00061A8476|nr:3-isopropylmalate dehydrogenase [Blochmannia endosymbiont of Polyrhachis (Hedomyrma) turneri]AKC59715.1 3-isopropylmalate dehydrogenase [Blochmannia endosymbiont of Polyrhachis (Hedomyrma) turneri]
MHKKYKITILPGDGIGPEIMQQAYKIINNIQQYFKITISLHEHQIGGIAIDKTGTALPQNTLTACEKSDAILLGSVGGKKWNTLPPDQQPERGGLLTLRKKFELFANLRPARTYQTLKHLSPLRNNTHSQEIDILCVRELTGGIYFGTPRGHNIEKNNEYAYNTEIYYRYEIERIAHIAFKLARKRRQHITSVDKANVLESSILWRNTINKISKNYPEITLTHLYIDNAIMQLIENPHRFDVILCSNLFGDIISDACASITGSIGMLPSASLNEKYFGLYEPAGGSAPDIAGKNIANPIAQILSLALLFRYSLRLHKIANIIEHAVIQALQKGYRTQDIANNKNIIVGTNEMGDIIASLIKH